MHEIQIHNNLYNKQQKIKITTFYKLHNKMNKKIQIKTYTITEIKL